MLGERVPELAATRVEADRDDRRRLLVHYDSPQRLCWLVEGLLMGVAIHYGEACVILCHFDPLA